jgi:hypothetical protein
MKPFGRPAMRGAKNGWSNISSAKLNEWAADSSLQPTWALVFALEGRSAEELEELS